MVESVLIIPGEGFKYNNGTNMFHMEQKLSFEIIDTLKKRELHTRAIAKKLNTNHMTISRKLKRLVKENILDTRTEGKNKIYYLKKSSEARNYTIMTELHKLTQTLERYPELRNITQKIQRDKRIKLAILFGSYAKNTVRKESDIDLFIETQEKEIKKETELLNSKLVVKIGDYDRKNTLIKEIEKNHIIIKGAERYYEKTELLQ